MNRLDNNRTAQLHSKQGVQRRQVLVVNVFDFLIFCFALLLLYFTFLRYLGGHLLRERELLTLFTVCSICILTYCTSNFNYFPLWF